jgi:hypothetical protein
VCPGNSPGPESVNDPQCKNVVLQSCPTCPASKDPDTKKRTSTSGCW